MWLYAALATIPLVFLCKNKRYRWFYIFAKTFQRDLRIFIMFSRLILKLWLAKRQNVGVPTIFSNIARKYPDKTAFLFENEKWSFAEADNFSNAVARYFKLNGLEKGDVVALLLENSAEYACLWLGLSKIGVTTALINTNLVNQLLLHSLNAAKCKVVIFGSNFSQTIKNIEENLESLKLFEFIESSKNVQNSETTYTNLRKDLQAISQEPLDGDNIIVNHNDNLLYIYTSGTTGLPKPAVITNARYIFAATAMHLALQCKYNDVIYCPLPFYHAAGCVLGLGQTLLFGTSIAIRKKFSASNYWTDCVKYNCTIGQYIGEMCRYILVSSGDEPVKHNVTRIIGNGLRPQIWKQFVDKFGIKQVYEIYGSTEGVSNIINIDNTVGSVGFYPRYLKFLRLLTLIKCNQYTGEPIRNNDGFCTECETNEPGILIGKIMPKKEILSFKGYCNENETKKKILCNVFKNGDFYFNSGDILICDEFGYFFFKDRTGDTFRWKGENVSTSEVEAIISSAVQLKDCIVFGVEIPETEGRAGMAAIVDDQNNLDMDELASIFQKNLPNYAIPIFIRVMDTVPLTGTYKLKKTELQQEGYDINKIKDKLYFFDIKAKKYTTITDDLYKQITTGKLRI